MALVNCSMDKETVVVPSGEDDVASITLEIIPDSGYVVAARDFVTGDYSGFPQIASITLTDTETTGGPQNDGSYTPNNKILVTVDFEDTYTFNESVVLDIDPSGEATIDYLTPVKLQGTFVVPSSPVKCTFVASNVNDYASSAATDDFYVYDNPGDEVLVMNMTIAATSGDFLNIKPTAIVTNSTAVVLDEDYNISSVETLDANNRLTQVAYTIKTNLHTTNRSGDLITFTGSGADIPGVSSTISGYRMDISNLGLNTMRRNLEVYGDSGAEFRIKIERGTLDYNYDPPAFTVDSTDGEYVFNNTLETIADAFYPSGSNITYPSEIDANGNYAAATYAYTLGENGVFLKKISIPEDIDGKVYRFTIIPESGTTVDPSAPGYLDVTPDPDVITFDIKRYGDVYIEATTNTSRSLTSETVEYLDYDKESMGTDKPYGSKESEGDDPFDTYSYSMVIEDDVDFHLPNEANSFSLTDQNCTKDFHGGSTSNVVSFAELRANANGPFYAEIQSIGHHSHIHAEAHETDTEIVLTIAQRTALTSKTTFNAASFSDAFTIVNEDYYFKIKYFTTDDIPIYKSQTIKITEDLVVAGDEEMQNVTTISPPAIDRTKLYIYNPEIYIKKWGDSNMSVIYNLDTFAFTTAQTGIVTLNLSANIEHTLRNFLNDIATEVGYVEDLDFSQTMLVSNDNETTYVNSNITTSTTHVKFNISGAYLIAEDKLPMSYDINDYQMLLQYAGGSSELSTVQLSITSAPTVSLLYANTIYRKLTVSNFEVTVDFNNTLTSLSASEDYTLSMAIVHQLSQQYKSIEDIEGDVGDIAVPDELAEY